MGNSEEFIHTDEEMLLRQLIREDLERSLIYEGLIFSYPISYIYRKLHEKNYNSNYINKSFSIKFILSTENIKKYEELNDFMDKTCGWKHGASIAGGQTMKNKLGFLEEPVGTVFLQYEPKFDVEISKLPPLLYHLTTFNKLKKISEIGLVPKSSDNFFSFDDRIYLSKDIESLYSFISKKIFTNNKYNEKTFIILQVKPDSSIRFFEDINFPQGIYTKENIKRFSTKPIEKIELDEKGEIIKKEKL